MSRLFHTDLMKDAHSHGSVFRAHIILKQFYYLPLKSDNYKPQDKTNSTTMTTVG